MFTLQLDWDRSAKLAAHACEHVLRVCLQPQANATTRSLPLRLALAIPQPLLSKEGQGSRMFKFLPYSGKGI